MAEQSIGISRRTFLGGVAAFSVISLVASPIAAFATPTAAEKQAEADQVRTKYNSLNAELTELANVYGAAVDEHDAAVAAMDEAQVRIEEANGKIGGLQDRLGTRVRSMYRSGGTSFFDILLGASSFEEFATSWDLLTKLNEDDAELVAEVKSLREEIQAAHDEYARQEKLAAEKLEEARVAKESLEASAAEYKTLLDSLDAETLALLQAEQEAALALAAQEAIAAQQAAAPTQPANSDSPSGGYSGGSAADFGPPSSDVLSEAAKYVGVVPYVYGGSSPETGFDCSGFVCYCLARVGRSVPPRSTDWYPSTGWFPVSEAQPGDILWQPGHVGICTSAGGGSYVHASDPTYGICYSSYPQFIRAYRY